MQMAKKKPVNTPGNYVFGRPTEYTNDMPEVVMEYLQTTGVKKDKKGYIKKLDLPTMAGLALYMGRSKQTLLDWADRFPDFMDALSILKNTQENTLINNGLLGRFNSTITKLMLSNNYGYQERKDITSAGKEMKSFNFQMNEPSEGHKMDSNSTSG